MQKPGDRRSQELFSVFCQMIADGHECSSFRVEGVGALDPF